MATKHICILVILVTSATIQLCFSLKIRGPSQDVTQSPTPHPKTILPNGVHLPYIHLLNDSLADVSDPFSPYQVSDANADPNSLIFMNGTVYVVPSTRMVLALECEARYPVFWNLAHSHIPPAVYNSLRVLSTRKFDDPFDPTTFTYVTILIMNGGGTSQLTGNYSCQSAARHDIKSNVYIFWKPSYGSPLVLARENLTITLKSEKEDVTLPCRVSDPDEKPKLFKIVDSPNQPQHLDELHLNDSISFFPTMGFTLHNLPTPLGTYKCSVESNDEQFIRVIRKNGESNTGNEPNYTMQYDEDTKQVRCCSKNGGRKPPKIFMMVCEHPSTCGLREFFTDDSLLMYPWNQGRRRKGCSVLSIKSTHTGIVRCVGDGGFNIFKEFIAPVRVDRMPWNEKRNTTTYFRWEEIDPQEMIQVGFPSQEDYLINNWDNDGSTYIAGGQTLDQTIYSEQLINLGCHTSRYYFASGNYWMIRWKNQTINQLVDETNLGSNLLGHHRLYTSYDQRHLHANMVSFRAHTEMESVICFAPVWNSSVWVTKIHYLYVNESMAPLLVAGDTHEIEHQTWYANETEKILTCSSGGVPQPVFHWEKDNVTILATSYNFHVFTPNASTLPHDIVTTTMATTTTTTSSSASVTGSSLDDDGVGGRAIDDDDNSNNSNGNETGTAIMDGGDDDSVKKTITPKMSHTSLRISRVSYNSRGIFRCVGTNFGGRVTKEFHITVLDAKSWTATIFFVISCILTVILMVGIIFLIRRLHKDRQEINQLTGTVNFQNGGVIRNNILSTNNNAATTVTTNSTSSTRTGGVFSSTAAIISSTTTGSSASSGGYTRYRDDDSMHNSFDNGKMTNNLIDTF